MERGVGYDRNVLLKTGIGYQIFNQIEEYLVSRALVQGGSTLEKKGLPVKVKLVSVKESVSVRIGKFIKIGIGIGMLFLLEKKSVSVSVCYLLHRIGIGIGKVKSFKIG